jgi:class 3 adenylate cyclase/tetratricopeptide (TPR) repeat protein
MAAAARKTVTVLFCDLADSTPLGDRLDPEALRALYGRYYDATRAAAERHGGTVEKYIGDAVMAVFGIPAAHEDDALRAVRAAFEIRAAAQALDVVPRIGIETGEVFAGDAGEGHAFATGPAVVTAERLEKEAGGGGILLGEATYRLVAHAVEAEPAGELVLKGRSQAVHAWRVAAVEDSAPPFARRLDTPLVGRTRELAFLAAELEHATASSRCRLVSVLGAAGVGKSRLVLEFADGLGERAGLVVGRCLRYGAGATYQPLVDVVRQAAGLRDGADEEEATARLEAIVGDRAAAHTLGALVSGGEPAATEQLFWALRTLLEAVAAERPLVVVLEDVEWAEPTLLDLVDYLVGWSLTRPILLLALARSELLENRPAWSAPGDAATALFVEPLPDADSVALLERLAGGPVEAAAARRLADTAAGNPLFLEELLRMLVDDGTLADEAGVLSARGGLEHVPVPRTIQAVLAARLDRLEPEERAVLQRAAVLGSEFWWSALAALSPDIDGAALGAHLQMLVRKQLVAPTASELSGVDAFRFHHALIRDTAYDTVPKATRADVHRRAAAWLAAMLPAKGGEWDEVLGAHYERAYLYTAELGGDDVVSRERGAAHLAAAGRRALARADGPAAARLLERAAGLAPDELEVALYLAVALRERGELAESARVAADVVARAESAGDVRIAARARLEAVRPRIFTDPEHGVAAMARVAVEVLPTLSECGDEVGTAIAEANTALTAYGYGQWRTVLERVGAAIERARALGDARLLGELVRMYLPAVLAGPLPASEALERCRELAVDVQEQRSVEGVLELHAAVLEAMLGRFDVARERARDNIVALADRGSYWTGAMQMFVGRIDLLAGEYAAAERTLRGSLDLLAATGDRTFVADVAPHLAEALLGLDEVDAALTMTIRAEEAATTGDVVAAAAWRSARARALALLGDAEGALAFAREAVDLAAATDYPNLRGRALESLADALEAAGETDAAATAAADAVSHYEAKENLADARRLSRGLPARVRGEPPA